ncbi:MAG: hypothetical protein KF703_04745 [Actinobacteria bacterium]|nr:hypothetical protein [Actinomycetota bacterium]
MTDYLVPVYATYLVTTVVLCTWLARTLFHNGAVFLRDVFPDRPDLADAVNHLLVTGFAMLNLGYGFFLLKGGRAADGTTAFEVLANKLGILLVSLAVVHFANLFVFHRIADRRRVAQLHPPVAPQRYVDDFPTPDAARPLPPMPPAAGTPAGWSPTPA